MKDDNLDKNDFDELVDLFSILKKWRDELNKGKNAQLQRLSEATGNEIGRGLVN